MIHLKIIHVDQVPKLAEKLGMLATVKILGGSARELLAGEFEDASSLSRWRLTSVAMTDPPNGETSAVAFKRVNGDAQLSVGMELHQVTAT